MKCGVSAVPEGGAAGGGGGGGAENGGSANWAFVPSMLRLPPPPKYCDNAPECTSRSSTTSHRSRRSRSAGAFGRVVAASENVRQRAMAQAQGYGANSGPRRSDSKGGVALV